MNVAVAMTLIAFLGLLWLWWPAIWDLPASPPERHPHLRAMDALAADRVLCPVCEGAGAVRWIGREVEPCPSCDGRGEVERG